jgi:hypothetical protein
MENFWQSTYRSGVKLQKKLAKEKPWASRGEKIRLN